VITRLPEIPKNLENYGYFLELVRSLEQALDSLTYSTSSLVNVQSMSLEKDVVVSDADLGKNSAILVDTTAGAVTVSLPPPATNYRSVYVVKKISADSNALYIEARESGNVEDVAVFGVNEPYTWVQLISDGYDYWVISQGCCDGGGGGGAVDSVNGQIGVVVLDKSDIGLSDVNNTSDLDKPISTDTQTALNAKVDSSALGELVDDQVAGLLVAGTNVTLTYDDTLNTLTIDSSGGSGDSYFPSGW
jgi:hypothetical protein